jgi:hypothetical protein
MGQIGPQRQGSCSHSRRQLAAGSPYVPEAIYAAGMCSPSYDGIPGISRGDQGRLIGLWRGCEEKQVGATQFQDARTSKSVHIGEWVATGPSLQNSFSLQPASAPNRWSTWQPGPETFEPAHRYTLVAWAELNETNSIPVEFTSKDLDQGYRPRSRRSR